MRKAGGAGDLEESSELVVASVARDMLRARIRREGSRRCTCFVEGSGEIRDDKDKHEGSGEIRDDKDKHASE